MLMLTHGQVVGVLENIAAEIKICPDLNSSSQPPLLTDTPEYWQIFICTPRERHGRIGCHVV